MSILESFPEHPLSKREIETLEDHERIHGIAPVGLSELFTDQTAVAELVIVTEAVVVGAIRDDSEWQIVYRGEKGVDGEQSELFDEAWAAVEDHPEAPDNRHRGPLDG
jgi:hypothetical protein